MNAIKVWPAAALLGLCAAAALAPPAHATAVPAPQPQAQIPFANHHGIYDWRVIDDHTLLIQSEGGTWYRATLMGSCFNLPFAERIGFTTNPDGSFDRFSSILVRDQHCPLTSLVVTKAPTGKHGGRRVEATPQKPKKS
ncbi:MAG TPA: DUF6491 family protein [Steroidobacteraceae bacterium]|nr:DUF6491 family protein [Steroidobacteraceae bacterium]